MISPVSLRASLILIIDESTRNLIIMKYDQAGNPSKVTKLQITHEIGIYLCIIGTLNSLLIPNCTYNTAGKWNKHH